MYGPVNTGETVLQDVDWYADNFNDVTDEADQLAGRVTVPAPRPRPPAGVLQVNYDSGMANIEANRRRDRSDIQAVARVGQICALFGPHATELTAADVAERPGLNRTTAYRYCASMVAAGILERGAAAGHLRPRRAHAPARHPRPGPPPGHRDRATAPRRAEYRRPDDGGAQPLGRTRARSSHSSRRTRSRSAVVTVRAGTLLDATAAQTQRVPGAPDGRARVRLDDRGARPRRSEPSWRRRSTPRVAPATASPPSPAACSPPQRRCSTTTASPRPSDCSVPTPTPISAPTPPSSPRSCDDDRVQQRAPRQPGRTTDDHSDL